MWWNVYIALYSKFPAESVGERIFKIGYDLTKLLRKVWWLPFFGSQCSIQISIALFEYLTLFEYGGDDVLVVLQFCVSLT